MTASERHWAGRLFFIALVARVLCVLWLNLAPAEYKPVYQLVAPDSTGYLALAESIRAGNGYQFGGGDFAGPTRIPPLYPHFLALLSLAIPLTPLLVGLVQSVLGAVTAVLVYWLSLLSLPQALGASRLRIAVTGTLLFALLPHCLLAVATILKEPLSTFLLVAFAGAWARLLHETGAIPASSRSLLGWSALAGALMGVSVISRYLHLGLLALFLTGQLVAWFWARSFAVSRRAVVTATGVGCLAFALALAPWLARNYLVTGEVVLSTHGPMRYLYNANSSLATPETWGYYEAKTLKGPEWDQRAEELAQALDMPVPEKDPDQLLHPAIVEGDDGQLERERKFASATAWSVRSHPGHVLQLVWAKMVNTWRPVWAGSSRLTWLAIGIPHIALTLLAGVGAALTLGWLRRFPAPQLLVPLAMVLYFVAAHAVFYGMIRSRLYIIPFLCPLAGIALVWLRERFTPQP